MSVARKRKVPPSSNLLFQFRDRVNLYLRLKDSLWLAALIDLSLSDISIKVLGIWWHHFKRFTMCWILCFSLYILLPTKNRQAYVTAFSVYASYHSIWTSKPSIFRNYLWLFSLLLLCWRCLLKTTGISLLIIFFYSETIPRSCWTVTTLRSNGS